MLQSFYSAFSWLNTSLRRRHYRLYRGLVESPWMHRLMRGLSRHKQFIARTPEGYGLVVNPLFHNNFLVDDSVADYETEVQCAINMLVRPGMKVYDIGANVGLFSVLFSHLVGEDGRVCAFEPSEINFACLQKTKALNNLGNLVIETVCVSDRTGEQVFDLRGGANSGRIVDATSRYQSKNLARIAGTTLDDYVIAQDGPAPDLVKIDVEGNEIQVIRGMTGVLERCKPILMCEVHTHLGDDVGYVFNILRDQGYSCYRLNDFIQAREKTMEGFSEAGFIIAMVKQ